MIPLNFIFCLFFTYESVISNPQSIYLMGDSLAQGLSQPISQYAKNKKIKFHSRTIVGSTSFRWSKSSFLEQDLKTYKPDLILVSLGTNDMVVKKSPQKSIETISQKLLTTKARVVWLIPPSMPFQDHGVREVIYSLSSQIDKLECDDSVLERSEDKIHFTRNGYSDWAKCIKLFYFKE